MKLFENEKALILILILFSAVLFFTGIGSIPLTDPDETFYAETAKEMLARGEYLTPYIFGKPQFEKPPLYYWFVMLGFKLFGVNEFGARFASAVFGILGVIGVYLLGKALINKKTGFLAGIVLATNVEYLVLSKACVTDMLLCVITLYAFLCFFYSRFPASAVLLGLAVLTKGPVGVFLPLAIIGIYLVLTKGLKKLKEMPLLLCAAVFLAVSLPWYFFAYKTHGKEFIDIFFGFHNITRFLAPEHASGDVFYYYVPLTIASFFPWVAFLPMAAWQALREKEAGIRKANIFLVVWFFVIFTFFSISRTKLPTYTFGFFPALALLTARLFDVFSEEGLTLKMRRGMTVSIVLFLILIISGIVGLCAVAASKYPSAAPASYAAGSVFVLLMVFFTATLLMRKYRASSIICILSFLIFLLPIYYVVMPEIARYESSKEIAGRLAVLMKPGEPLGAETRYVRGIAFYTGKEDVLDVHAHHVITKFLDRDERVWCVVKEKNYNQLYDLYDDNRKPYDKPTYVLYKLGKKVIVTNKMPPGLTYLQMREKSK